MKEIPVVKQFENGMKTWEQTFDTFRVKVCIPHTKLYADVINYGFRAPYLCVFEESPMTMEEAVSFALDTGLSKIASDFASSVVFVYPTAKDGWDNAGEEIFTSLISNTKISQYYEDGMALMRDRFTGNWGEHFIRGAIARSNLFGFGKSADFIARNLLKTVEGDGMFGKGDITPTVCILSGLSELPAPTRRDIPVISIGNSEEINAKLKNGLDYCLIKERADFVADYYAFSDHFRRMVGRLEEEPDLESLDLNMEPGYFSVKTSKDNRGDDRDTKEHKIGYMAFYKKGIMDEGRKVPLLFCFHGGGDSIFFMTLISGWHKVAAKYGFLLVVIENHLNSTATEMMEFLEQLKQKYNIDSEKIYSTGFSMGGCKSWDMYQEYPEVFAAVAPMDATFEVGLNIFGEETGPINQDVIVPVFYVGGEATPLPELPFQAQKCVDRMAYVFDVNKVLTPYEVSFEKQEEWANPIWGINGDEVVKLYDDEKDCTLTLNLFRSEGDYCYSIFGSVTDQGHELRYHNCENAWRYMSQFRRLENGELQGGDFETIKELFEKNNKFEEKQ